MTWTQEMMGAAKPASELLKKFWLGIPVLALILVILFQASGLYRQYQDGREVLRHAEPIVDELYHIHHQVMMPDAEDAVLLDDKVRRLSLMLTRFRQHLEQSSLASLGPVAGDQRPAQYLNTLQALQQAELHARHSLSAFSEAVAHTPGTQRGDALQSLLQRSRLYLYSTNPLFVRELNRQADALQKQQPQLEDVLYMHGIYSADLRLLIELRHTFADTSIGDFYDWISRWRQRTEDSRDRLLTLSLALVLGLLLVGGALLFLNNRKWRQASRTARALAQAKTDFLANMSHEIRTPMNAIIGFVSLLQQTGLDARQADYLQKIRLSSDNLLLLINDILDLTKVEAGKLELEDIDFDLNELLERLSGLFADMSEQKQLEVIIDKAAEVPDRIQGDPLRLGQVLTNLVNNALKFTERGEVVLAIRVLDGAEPRLCFEVRDTGIGIMPQQLKRLFQSFTQVDASTTRKYGGSGLGLSICRHLVELMQGRIHVSSEPGRGSCFRVELPLRPAGEAEPAYVPGLEAGGRVLVVDDNPLAAEVMTGMLTRAGFVVYCASNAEMAKSLLQKRGSELGFALIDCCLGRENGMDLARYIRQQPHLEHIGIVVVSAFGRERPAAQMQTLGIEHYLPKPVTWPRLANCLSALLKPGAQAPQAVTADTDTEYYRRRLSGCRVLLAEDNRLNQQLVVEYLGKVGASVSLADNGRQAVEQVTRQRFDVILMDLQMPILDGLEATRQIRKLQQHHDTPIIALTASAMRSDRESSIDSGMNAYVSKPVNRAELYQALLTWCGREAAEPQPAESGQTGTVPAGDADSRARFVEQCSDQLWMLQAAQAEQSWEEADTLLQELARHAEAAGEAELAEQARAASRWPAQGQVLPHATLAVLQQKLNRALERYGEA